MYRRRKGFTLLEILIAIVVLVLGITGIVALFPTAIESGNQTVDDSYAAAIAQSVTEAIGAGLRESRYTWDSGAGIYTYFIFNHDGVLDPPPPNPGNYADAAQEIWAKDYCILLPRGTVADPNTVVANEPIFYYPVPNQETGAPGALHWAANDGQRSDTRLTSPANQTDNYNLLFRTATTVDDTVQPWFSRTYRLGRYRDGEAILAAPPPRVSRDIRREYLGEDVIVGEDELMSSDPYVKYSFAFALTRARVDNNPPAGQITSDDDFSSSLYELKIMVFKNFNQAAADALAPDGGGVPTGGGGTIVPDTNVPLRIFVSKIAP